MATGVNKIFQKNYMEAIAIDNLFYPSKVNLVILYYSFGQSNEASALFNDLISKHPEIIDGY